MLVIERASRSLRGLPRLTQLGIAALLAGLVLDVFAHLGWSSGLAAGHLVTLAGMVLAVVGVLALAFQRRPVNQLAEKRR
jgi:hypothetical protein